MPTAILRAGIPATNKLLFHRMRFSVGDPAAIIDLPAREPADPELRDAARLVQALMDEGEQEP